MITIGKTYNLPVVKSVHSGFLLDAKNLGEIHLAQKYAPADLAEGDTVSVFIYLASDGVPIATTEKPYCQLGEFAYLRVVDTSNIGAFVDIGLEKDVLVPFIEQHLPMKIGKSYIVHLYLDKRDGRITGSSKIDKFIDDEAPHNFTQGQGVNLLIANTTDLGFKAIVDNSHWGVLYKNEVFQRLSFGQGVSGFIKSVRPDGRLDLSLQGGKQTRDKYEQIILDYLEKNKGFALVHDKSDPQEISRLFGMSKKAFKKTIGGLYKKREIIIEPTGIRLIEKN